MKTETLAKIEELIGRATEKELNAIYEAIQLRSRSLRYQRQHKALATLEIGDRVRLTGIKPKYMSGHLGTITGRRQTKFEVQLDLSPSSRFGQNVIVPATCLTKVD
jgi:hypothetical protein